MFTAWGRELIDCIPQISMHKVFIMLSNTSLSDAVESGKDGYCHLVRFSIVYFALAFRSGT